MKRLCQKALELWNSTEPLRTEFSKITVTTYASSISYFTFLSLIPLLAICISLLSVLGISEQDVLTFFQLFLPDALDELVSSIVSDAYDRSGIAFSLSTLTLLWSASKGARALRAGLNAAYDEKETRGMVVVILISILAGLLIDILLAATIYLVFSGSISSFLSTIMPDIDIHDGFTTLLDSLLVLLVGALSLAACYAYLPAGKRRYLSQLPGALCATIACGLLSFGFRIYVDNFSNYTVLYGSLATVAMLLFWMYLVSIVLVTCGFLNRLFMSRDDNEDSSDTVTS